MQKKQSSQIAQNEYIYSILFISFVWVLLFVSSGLFGGAGFNYFLDDHQILLSQGQYTTFKDIFFEPFTSLLIAKQERFRPIYILFLRLFSCLYGLKPFIWYLSSCVMAIGATICFYFFARNNLLNRLESMGFSLLTVFGNQASTFARFGTPETTSTLFIALAFLCASILPKQWMLKALLNGLFILFAILAALNKEACILMLPALIFYHVWKYKNISEKSWAGSIKSNVVSTLILAVVFVLLLLYIKFMGVSGPGYGGVSASSFTFNSLKQVVKTLITKTSILLAGFVAVIYVVDLFKKQSLKTANSWSPYILGMLIILPQMILYSKSGIDNHYLFPAVIGIALITVFPLVKIRVQYPKTWLLCLTVISIIIIQHAYVTFKYQWQVTQTTKEIERLFEEISKKAGANKEVLIFGNPYTHFEKLFGFKVVMEKQIKNSQTFLATYGSRGTMLSMQTFEKDENKWSYIDPKIVEQWYAPRLYINMTKNEKSQIQTIILLSPDISKTNFAKWTTDQINLSAYSEKQYSAIDLDAYYRK